MYKRIVSACLAITTGVLTFSAFPTAWFPDVNLYPLIWFSHVPLLWLLKDKGPKAAFWWGWLAGTVTNVGGYYWIAHMLGTFGGFPAALAAAGSVIHGAYLGRSGLFGLCSKPCNLQLRLASSRLHRLQWSRWNWSFQGFFRPRWAIANFHSSTSCRFVTSWASLRSPFSFIA